MMIRSGTGTRRRLDAPAHVLKLSKPSAYARVQPAMLSHRTFALAFALTLIACGPRRTQSGSPPREHSGSSAPSRLPPPVDVCVATDGGLTPAIATPSYAGTYDPNVAPDPTLLNWMIPHGGCVTYPGTRAVHDRCGGDADPRPVVTPTLCQQ